MAPGEKPAMGSPPCGNACNHCPNPKRHATTTTTERRIACLIFFVTCVCILQILHQSLVINPYGSLSYIDSIALQADALKSATWPWTKKDVCQPPSPNLFAHHPPRPASDLLQKASKDLDEYLSKRVSEPEIDSIALSIVTPAGPIFLGGYGSLRANDSSLEEDGQVVDGDSIYRIASISKMFTALETLILRERGALNWDDPVNKYIAGVSLPSESYGWANYIDGLKSEDKPRVTLRQLASHMGGIGRDYPPMDIGKWPTAPEDFPSYLDHFRSKRELNDTLDAVSRYPLVNTPYSYPIYSNTGFSLLGLANIGADAQQSPMKKPLTHKVLLHRDIFVPLQMNSSFFRVPASEALRAHVAVPAKNSEWADTSLGEVNDPAGGQYSSLNDLSRLMKTLLSPTAAGGVIPAPIVREWLRPLHVWGTSAEQVGAPWETAPLSGVTAYTKGGNLPGYHSEFALIPEYSFGIVLLVTGSNADTTTLLKETAKRYVPAFEKLHEVELRRRYNGKWTSGDDVAEVSVKNGVLHMNKLIVDGRDVLELALLASSVGGSGRAVSTKGGGSTPVALWPTGRAGEFRLAFGRPALNKLPGIGCMPYWVSLDAGVTSRGAPLDVVYWQRGELVYPSAGVAFKRS